MNLSFTETDPTATTLPGSLFIISAPSGAGKSSLVKALRERVAGLALSVSCTTRPPRPGEQNGVHYHFVSDTEFDQMLTDHGFVEWAQVHGNRYGTPKHWLETQLKADQDIILEIDWQGALQVIKLAPQVVSVFILPPSLIELERRLRGRATDPEAVIERRLAAAKTEIEQAKHFDYVILNDCFENALDELAAIVLASRCRFTRQMARHQAQFRQLGL